MYEFVLWGMVAGAAIGIIVAACDLKRLDMIGRSSTDPINRIWHLYKGAVIGATAPISIPLLQQWRSVNQAFLLYAYKKHLPTDIAENKQ